MPTDQIFRHVLLRHEVSRGPVGVNQVPVGVNEHGIPAVVVLVALELVTRSVVKAFGKASQHHRGHTRESEKNACPPNFKSVKHCLILFPLPTPPPSFTQNWKTKTKITRKIWTHKQLKRMPILMGQFKTCAHYKTCMHVFFTIPLKLAFFVTACVAGSCFRMLAVYLILELFFPTRKCCANSNVTSFLYSFHKIL